MNKKLTFILGIVLLVGMVGGFFYLSERARITGYIILPADIQGQQKVIDYLKGTEEYELLEYLCVEEPEVDRVYLCSENRYNEFPCQNLNIDEKIEKFYWEPTYYWYVRFAAREWLEEPPREIYLEFLVKGNDGMLMDSHLGNKMISEI